MKCYYFFSTIIIVLVCESFATTTYTKTLKVTNQNSTNFETYKNIMSRPSVCNIERKSERVCNKYRTFFEPLVLIYGGIQAHDKEFPHMIALGFITKNKEYKFGCGGSLISPTFVLTAAHCVQNPEKMNVSFVRIGTIHEPPFTRKLTTYDVKVKKTISHPKYNRMRKLHDIALIELIQSVRFSQRVKPLCLYTRDDDPTIMEIVGWGAINFEGETSTNLQKAVLRLVAKCDCEKIYAKRLQLKVESCHICAGNHDVNICKGDSGGPLLLQGKNTVYQVGVIVYGEACGSRTPGLYARVSSYLDWIEEIVWKEK